MVRTHAGRSQCAGYRITESPHCFAKSNSFAQCAVQNAPTSYPPLLVSAAARPRDQPLNSSGVSWLALMPPGPSVLLTVAAAMTWWPCLKSLKVRLSFSLLLSAPAFTASLA